jgi:hypothetical protein
VKKAVDNYKVPRTTLGDRTSGRSKATLDRPTQLTQAEEEILVERVSLLGHWGFALTIRDFRELMKSYLDMAGMKTIFKDNCPTHNFVKHFLERKKTTYILQSK